MSGLYLLLAYTGCCVGELVGNEKKQTDGLYRELFPPRAGRARCRRRWRTRTWTTTARSVSRTRSSMRAYRKKPWVMDVPGRSATRTFSWWSSAILRPVETLWRGRSSSSTIKAPTSDVGSSPILAMTNAYYRMIFTSTLARRLIFCPVTVIVSLAVADGVFEAENMTSLRQVLSAGPVALSTAPCSTGKKSG